MKQGLKQQTPFLKHDQNDLSTERKEILQFFKKHFDTELNFGNNNKGTKTKYEELILRKIIQKLKNHKAPKQDDIKKF